MSSGDLEKAIAWAADEGWNPGLRDAHCFYVADPDGFLMGFLDGEPIASISAVKYGAEFGFIGFYIVKPEFRGQGYGWQIWQAALQSLKGRIIGLDGVVAQQSNYLKSGFKLAYRNIRYVGTRGQNSTANVSSRVIPLASYPVEAVIAYDRAFFIGDRAQFIHDWLAQPEHYAIGLLHQDKLAGYGVLRPCRQGYKIGPLFADTPDFAEDIFQTLKAQIPTGDSFYLDVPEVNTAAVMLARRHHLKSMFETARMYMPQIPELPTERIFGVTTFELG
ncbi:GNAT family N-acetyltransferase [Oscillatoria sp. CS-180]|uniref:GNAT family N-acetyltransferase n=1 Tax=Oscillatoria sp. CS-180 TaxID=3021720 RepID=UPI002330D90C|nr:GNAT family N-acetyltransferase [Oscillatoria sp. CS-180]MDB9529133.1 GNAT family N-acetyltransferase [Oscillatoria sp. CS-180]